MTQSTNLTPRPRPSFDWSVTPEKRKRSRPLERRSRTTQLALSCILAVLTALYLGPLQAEATDVLAVKKVLPIYSVEREDKVISVTFDASWGGDKTMAILDLLDEYNAKATFFLVGIWVDKYPELVQAIHERGHEIGNHSDSHPYMTQISEAKMRQELDGMSDKIEALLGQRPTLFRPPYGDYNNKVVTVSRDEGYEVVQWSIDSLDWKNRGVDDLVKRATTNVQPGDIILFHNDSEYIVQALPAILQYYQAQGFSMIPAGEILLSGETTIDVQGKQHPAAQQ
ncbi:MAG: polysaccharide deacetylase family protein [Clostridia bacterium]|nr:polysaccharide deacetylase family protein [Clostridia bacterium]